MNNDERQIQEALGLLEDYDVYVQLVREEHYRVYMIKATSKKEAVEIIYDKLMSQKCKIKKDSNIRFPKKGLNIYAIGPNPEIKMKGAKYYKI